MSVVTQASLSSVVVVVVVFFYNTDIGNVPPFFAADGEDDDDDLGDDDDDDDVLSLSSTEANVDEKDKAPGVVSAGSVHSSSLLGGASLSSPHQPTYTMVPGTSSAQANAWHPIHIKTRFIDGQMKVHQAIMVLLPGGVGHTKTEDIKLSLVEDSVEPFLKITVKWPKWIVSQDFLAIMRDTMTKEFAPRLSLVGTSDRVSLQALFQEYIVLIQLAFKQHMILMRPQADSPMLHSVAKIKLDFPVKKLTHDDWYIFGDEQGVRMVIVDLKAQEEKDFELTITILTPCWSPKMYQSS